MAKKRRAPEPEPEPEQPKFTKRRVFWGIFAVLLGWAALRTACEKERPAAAPTTAPQPVDTSDPTPATPPRPELPVGVWRTKADYVGATTKAKLDQAVRLVADGDRQAFAAMIAKDPEVWLLKPGVEVQLADAGGLFEGVVKVRIRGTTTEFWTVREAIER